MENNDRPTGSLLPEKDTRIQLVVNNKGDNEKTIDLGRILHNAKLGARIFSWVLVFCILLGISIPLLMYQFQKPMLTVSSVVSLRYNAPNPEYLEAEENEDTDALKNLEKIAPVSELVSPDGEALDLSVVISSPVLQKALDGMPLSKPVTLENIRNNITVTRVLTEESSRTKEALTGLAGISNNGEAYTRLENTELKYQNRFVVSLTNGFGEADSRSRYELSREEMILLLNRILDAYNDTLMKQWADIRLPEDKVSVIDLEAQDFPEVLDCLNTALNDLYAYCESQPDSAKVYRSWQTGLNLNEWMETIRIVQDVGVDYLDAYVYANGLMRDKESVRLTFRYRIRSLQNELTKVNETIAANEELLKKYKNDEVYINMQEADVSRSTRMTTAFYNELVLKQQEAYEEATQLRTQIAETQYKLERLDSSAKAAEISEAEEDLENTVNTVKDLFSGVRNHMSELFSSSLYTSYTDHSAPQGKENNFLTASWKKMLIGGVAGAIIAMGLWFLAALAPEFKQKNDENNSKADAEEKEVAQI